MSVLSSAFVGAAAGLGTTVIGTFVGSALEGPLGGPVVAWEMAPLVVGVLATVGGAFVGPLAAWGGTWRRGLVIGAGGHALVFGALLLQTTGTHPRAVLCWVTTTGVLAGAIAGTLCGAMPSAIVKTNEDKSQPATAGRGES